MRNFNHIRMQRKGEIPINENSLVVFHQQYVFCPDVVLFNLEVFECLYNYFLSKRYWKWKRIISKSKEGKSCFFIAVLSNFLKYGYGTALRYG